MTTETQTRQKLSIAVSMLREMNVNEYVALAIRHGEAAIKAFDAGDYDTSGAHLMKMDAAVKKARAEMKKVRA